ncbi:hypothetical protein [Pseudalkalibacillus caeni]|uniref:Lipoprotein n=1 Tax=Exobacillus caeni TaxID=2574798 RepID=A0A5R9F2X5_9BACL|nr:hypothetical protein [Pseudalkalibacillus caeni]TLS36840.1 hypothetical protein FCL54_12850 [Pseudalkalibacillus caeni]
MKKFNLVIASALLASSLAACSNPTSSSSGEIEKAEQQTDNQEQKNATSDPKDSGEKPANPDNTSKEKPEVEEKAKPVQPFEALEPAKDAKPLKQTMSEEDLAKMPVVEAHGEDRTRKTPVGQLLIEGKTDETDGPLKDHRLVTFYGHPDSTKMGILGEMQPDALMAKLKEQTQKYSNADPAHPAVPMIELITTVAQRTPGPNGLYYHMTSEEDIEKYVQLAKENNALLMLDVQLGRDNALHQAKLVEKWLKLPFVHLAIDTEFHVDEGQTPGIDLGQVDGAEIQETVEYVSKLVEENNLPDKVVLVHQFTDKAVANKQEIKPTENVEVALNFDGYGPSAVKMSLYRKFVRNDAVQYGGFKIFYQKDNPVLTPEEVLKLDPNPAIINYQ